MGTRQGPIGHLDADCFYVSAERVRQGDLVGVPVGVLGNQGACVIAKSYEMKAAGVATGMPIWDALRACPEGLYLKRDFRWYEVLSRAMLAVMRELSTAVEYYSIDEFFFDATPPRGLDPARYAAVIRDTIRERVGVPVTVGIARTRTLAELISHTGKPCPSGKSHVLVVESCSDDESATDLVAEGRRWHEFVGVRRRGPPSPRFVPTRPDREPTSRRLCRRA